MQFNFLLTTPFSKPITCKEPLDELYVSWFNSTSSFLFTKILKKKLALLTNAIILSLDKNV